MIRSALVTGVLVAGLTLTACGGHPKPAASRTPTPTPVVTTPAPPPPPPSPLTGLPPAGATVVAVKVDNVSTGAQAGLNDADVVYCELVEGGLTRLLAVFGTHQPTSVGPVRSARFTDVELLGEYGRIALAFSGANTAVLAAVKGANLQDDAYDYVPDLYHFDRTRPAPYQFLVDVSKAVSTAPGDPAKDIGFRFGPAPALPAATPPATPVAVTALSARFPAALVSATWDAASGSWLMSRDGRPQMLADGSQASASNILVQYVTNDGADIPTTKTVGSGQAVLFRNGARFDGTWSRSSSTSPTTWTAAGGGDLTLSTGRTWVILLPVGSALSVS